MTWTKQGLVFAPGGDIDWMASHAQIPTGFLRPDGTLRVLIGTRDAANKTRTGYVDVDPADPLRVVGVSRQPVLDLGPVGAFDDCGSMPSWVVPDGDRLWLYYIGWNVRNTVPYHNSIGLAMSDDGGETFRRAYEGPVLDRGPLEPFFCSAPCVLKEESLWRMWYLSCVRWQEWNGKPEPFYHLKYAESADGVRWEPTGQVAIDFKSDAEAGIVRPSILKTADGYRMWFCYRGYRAYRSDRADSYRIGYAESRDGILWERRDDLAGIDCSESGWDAEMIAYPWVYQHGSRLHLLYNGNGFGRSGFGCAVMPAA